MVTHSPLVRGALLPAAMIVSLWLLAGQALAAAALDQKSLIRNKDLCANAIRRVETQRRVPTGLMQAIALVESGRRDAATSARFAWPWTVHAEGKGRYFASKAAAVSAVRKLQARGVSNIDVGCMQVNLQYHGDRFDSIEAALDPARNAAYAAQFLESLYNDKKSWDKAIAYYHSGTPKLNRPYRAKVYGAWRERAGSQQMARATSRPAPVSPRSHLHRITRPNQQLLARSRRLQASERAIGLMRPGTGGTENLTSAGARVQPRKNLLRRLRPATMPRFQTTAKARRNAQSHTNPMTLNRPKTLRLYRQQGAAPKTYRSQLATAGGASRPVPR